MLLPGDCSPSLNVVSKMNIFSPFFSIISSEPSSIFNVCELLNHGHIYVKSYCFCSALDFCLRTGHARPQGLKMARASEWNYGDHPWKVRKMFTKAWRPIWISFPPASPALPTDWKYAFL